MSLTKRVLLALVAGIALGVLLAQTGSSALLSAVRWVEPLGTLWVNAIRMTVIPLIVASLVTAVASAPDTRVVGRIGAMAVVIFLVLLGATAAMTVLVAPPLLSGLAIDPAAAASLRESASVTGAAAAQTRISFVQWLVDLIPTNPVRAAADGSILPLIVFSIALGAAAIRISDPSRTALTRFFAGLAEAMLRLMHWILLLAPIGVFALVLPLAARLGLSAAGAVAYYVALVCGLCLVVGVLLYPTAALLGGVSIARFAQASAQAQAVAASSRSSLMALPPMLVGAESGLALNPAVTRFFLPLSASTFRIGTVVVQIVGVLFLARLYAVDINPPTLLLVAFVSVLTSFSVPAIAGGSIIVMLPVLAQAGIPAEGVGILLGVDLIPDIFRTVVNVTAHMTGAAIIDRHAGAEIVPAESIAPAA